MRKKRDYSVEEVISLKKQGLSGEQISRKLKRIITANYINYLWRAEMGCKNKGGRKK